MFAPIDSNVFTSVDRVTIELRERRADRLSLGIVIDID